MRFVKSSGYVALACFLAVVVSGCGKKTDDQQEESSAVKKTSVPSKSGTRVQLQAPLDGVVRGRVVLDGEMPTIAPVEKMAVHADHAQCLAGSDVEKNEQTWIISKDKGVANVVVFLRPPQGKYFDIRPEDKNRTDKVVVRQPHCAYVPHVSAAFPSYFDGKEQKRTGQAFLVINDAPINHNTKWQGDALKTGTGNRNLRSGEELPIELKVESEPITLGCDVHPWMRAKVWAFDHPYAAVTGADGTFEIKNVPTGVEVGVVAWHESPGYFNGGKEGTKTTFKKGDNALDLKVRAK
jgi:hypothetical protein